VAVLSVGSFDDEVARFVRQHADRYLEVPPVLADARNLLAKQAFDVLFYTDVVMNPLVNTLAYSRLAPVQCVTWGHPETTALATMDYFLSSELFETEDADRHYTEKLVRLATLPAYCYR